MQELASGRVEIAAIDPVASMAAVDNPQLKHTAQHVRDLLQQVVESLCKTSGSDSNGSDQ